MRTTDGLTKSKNSNFINKIFLFAAVSNAAFLIDIVVFFMEIF
jgi:hypothetical protein